MFCLKALQNCSKKTYGLSLTPLANMPLDKLINQVDAQYKYSLNVIPQQLAFINHAMQHFEQVRKLGKTWNVIKQDILNSNGLFDNQINDAEHNLQEEYKWNKK